MTVIPAQLMFAGANPFVITPMLVMVLLVIMVTVLMGLALIPVVMERVRIGSLKLPALLTVKQSLFLKMRPLMKLLVVIVVVIVMTAILAQLTLVSVMNAFTKKRQMANK
jgi:hypothetical protein